LLERCDAAGIGLSEWPNEHLAGSSMTIGHPLFADVEQRLRSTHSR